MIVNYVVYNCRRCKEKVGSSELTPIKGDPILWLQAAVTGMNRLAPMYLKHDCKDGGIGLCELAGVEKVEIMETPVPIANDGQAPSVNTDPELKAASPKTPEVHIPESA